jgi:hypothetical protein
MAHPDSVASRPLDAAIPLRPAVRAATVVLAADRAVIVPAPAAITAVVADHMVAVVDRTVEEAATAVVIAK